MTEQEIIDFLKKNKETGIAFAFMPDEVQEWCYTNNGKVIFYHISKINHDGEWADHSDNDVIFEPTDIVALPDSFQMLKEQKSGWVEFNVNSKGEIAVDIDDDKEPTVFNWNEWGVVLAYSRSSRNKAKYVAFGGWQYKDSKNWYQYPILLKDNGQVMLGFDDSDDVKPAIPIKIRFLRESQ